jgi:hypothetical protein
MFKLLRWMQKMNQSMRDRENVYADIYSKDEHLLFRPFKEYERGRR